VIYRGFTSDKRFRADNGRMRSKRFGLLASVLVALNLALWIVPQGLALRRAVVQQLFGSKLIRADVLDRSGGSTVDWRIDRGVVVGATSTQITVREFDGRVQPIPVSTSTHVTGFGRVFAPAAVKRGWRVLITWPANGAATSVVVEARGKARGLHTAGSAAAPLPPLS